MSEQDQCLHSRPAFDGTVVCYDCGTRWHPMDLFRGAKRLRAKVEKLTNEVNALQESENRIGKDLDDANQENARLDGDITRLNAKVEKLTNALKRISAWRGDCIDLNTGEENPREIADSALEATQEEKT